MFSSSAPNSSAPKGEDHLDEWVHTIKDVRAIYKGQLTYSSNWDRYWKVPFWKYLDFIGMNSYWTLGQNRDVTVDQINDEWKKIQERMFKFTAEIHKPVILLEAGWCSLANAAKDPWDYTQDTAHCRQRSAEKIVRRLLRKLVGQAAVGWINDLGNAPRR